MELQKCHTSTMSPARLLILLPAQSKEKDSIKSFKTTALWVKYKEH